VAARRVPSGSVDAYQTPPWVFDYLADHIRGRFKSALDDPMPVVWDCACGKGNLVRAARSHGFDAFGTDILNGEAEDFLKHLPSRSFDIVVTNPPFTRKEEFIRRSYSLGRPFALLLPFSCLETRERQEIFKANPVEIVFLPKRAFFEAPDGKLIRTKFATAWFTWGLNIGRQLNFP
jgi:hypothetical protein